MFQQTSIESYLDIQPELGDRQKIVYDAFIQLGSATDVEVCKFLGFGDANRVRPRRFELVTKGFLEEKTKRACKVTGKRCIVWGIK